VGPGDPAGFRTNPVRYRYGTGRSLYGTARVGDELLKFTGFPAGAVGESRNFEKFAHGNIEIFSKM